MVAKTGTNEFCGGACHSMQWVAAEWKASGHAVNRTGVSAGCHDCHIPHDYPELLFYKAKAGIKDAIGEMRGVIDTEAKFKAARPRMAEHVWAEYKANNSPIAAPVTPSRPTWSRSRRTSCSRCTSSSWPAR
jgi:nitrate/TMAO reductase-like tetraheme cytochrome c subunit